MVKINYVCKECGEQSWFDITIESYIVSVSDLVCDDCNPVEEE